MSMRYRQRLTLKEAAREGAGRIPSGQPVLGFPRGDLARYGAAILRTDESREAKQLLAKLIEDKGVDDLLITLADCLKDHIRTGIHEEVMREQLATYAES